MQSRSRLPPHRRRRSPFPGVGLLGSRGSSGAPAGEGRRHFWALLLDRIWEGFSLRNVTRFLSAMLCRDLPCRPWRWGTNHPEQRVLPRDTGFPPPARAKARDGLHRGDSPGSAAPGLGTARLPGKGAKGAGRSREKEGVKASPAVPGAKLRAALQEQGFCRASDGCSGFPPSSRCPWREEEEVQQAKPQYGAGERCPIAYFPPVRRCLSPGLPARAGG